MMPTASPSPTAAAAETAKVPCLVAQSPAAANGVSAVDNRVHDGVTDSDDEENILYVFVHVVECLGVDEVPVGVRIMDLSEELEQRFSEIWCVGETGDEDG